MESNRIIPLLRELDIEDVPAVEIRIDPLVLIVNLSILVFVFAFWSLVIWSLLEAFSWV